MPKEKQNNPASESANKKTLDALLKLRERSLNRLNQLDKIIKERRGDGANPDSDLPPEVSP